MVKSNNIPKTYKPGGAKGGAHREGTYRCNTSKCPGHKTKQGFCTLL